ncbi:unnamed protein product [Rhodiola kirilowii]
MSRSTVDQDKHFIYPNDCLDSHRSRYRQSIQGVLNQSTTALVTVATAKAFSLTAAVYIASSASGGHVNPAVTFGLAVGGHITIPAAIFYWIAQLTGATLACFLLKAFAVSQPVLAYAIAAELSGFSASVLEGVATFALVYTVYAASDPGRAESGSGIGAVVIGLVCGAGVLAIWPFSGGSMNPECTFGADVASGRFRNQAVYWVGSLVGAAIGGLLYENVMFSSNGNRGRADQSTTALVTVATANAFVVTAAVYITSSASGGHVNPAVTFDLAISGHITIPAAIFYWIAQLTGATLACFLLKAFTVSQPVPAYAIAAELSGFSASILEGVATFALVYIVYAASDQRRAGSGSGIGAVVIGLVCGAGVLTVGQFLSGSMNPAWRSGLGVGVGLVLLVPNSIRNNDWVVEDIAEEVQGRLVVSLEDEDWEKMKRNFKWALVLKLANGMAFNITGLGNVLSKVWNLELDKRVRFKELASNMALAEFEYAADMARVRDGGPWLCLNSVVLFHDWCPELAPEEIKMTRLGVWAQFHNLPLGAVLMDKETGEKLAGYIGKFGRVDTDGVKKKFIRVRVEIDIEKPVVTGFLLQRQARDPLWISVKYERLPSLCQVCGRLSDKSNS